MLLMIYLFRWCPDVEKIKQKMLYASAKHIFKDAFKQLKAEFGGGEPSEFEESYVQLILSNKK
jgi:hypothetical protein